MERVGRILNVTRLSDRIWLCQALVNLMKYLTLSVTRAPGLSERVTFYQPMERPHATRITLNGNAAFKEISDSDAFYSQFGNSFEAIKVRCQHTNCVLELHNWLLLQLINEHNAWLPSAMFCSCNSQPPRALMPHALNCL